MVFLLLFRRVVSRINNGSALFHAKVIKDQILIIPSDWRIQLCTICHASSFHYFKYGSRTDIIYKAKQKDQRKFYLFHYNLSSVQFLFSKLLHDNYDIIYILKLSETYRSSFLSRFFPLISLISENIVIKIPYHTFDKNLLANKRQVEYISNSRF